MWYHYGMILSCLLVLGMLFRAEGPSTIEGVVLRAQEIPVAEEEAPMSRILLSTSEGLCAVRVPGDAADWDSYADAEVEIHGVMRDEEFVVDEESDINLLKYPSTDPDALRDVLPAGELVRRRIYRRNVLLASGIVFASVVLIVILVALVIRNRRKAYFFMGRVARERRRTGILHEDVEQQLEAVRMLLLNAIAFTPNTPKEIEEAVRTVSRILAETNNKVHRTAAAGAPLVEKRRRA